MTIEIIKNKIIELCPELKHCEACIDGTKFCGTQYSLCPCHHMPDKWKAECKIELNHVLQVIEITNPNASFRIYSGGQMSYEKEQKDPLTYRWAKCTWNLSKDFDGQEGNVKEFIGELLK